MGILSSVSSVLVLASHPDDETLGCGGTLLRHRSLGDTLTWCIGTRPTAPTWSETVIKAKEREIEQVAAAYGFARVHRLGHPATRLAEVDRSIVISQLREVAAEAKADTVYCVAGEDIHQDHQALFAAAASAFKPFRSAALSPATTVAPTRYAAGSRASSLPTTRRRRRRASATSGRSRTPTSPRAT